MRISDLSSVVCSSDLVCGPFQLPGTRLSRLVGAGPQLGGLRCSARIQPQRLRQIGKPVGRRAEIFWLGPSCQHPFALLFSRDGLRSEEHTSDLQSLMPISYAVFCLKKKTTNTSTRQNNIRQ